jgi:hypothetical protein
MKISYHVLRIMFDGYDNSDTSPGTWRGFDMQHASRQAGALAQTEQAESAGHAWLVAISVGAHPPGTRLETYAVVAHLDAQFIRGLRGLDAHLGRVSVLLDVL